MWVVARAAGIGVPGALLSYGMTTDDQLADVLHYTAFSSHPDGGNPAGVVLDAAGLDDAAMLAIAARLGYSESAFLTRPPEELGGTPGRAFTVRYFSPRAEVPFCGHATIASAVALAERIGPGDLLFATRAGTVPVTVAREADGTLRATLTSVAPRIEEIAPEELAEALAALDWPQADLDPRVPPRIAFAGARHLVLGAASRERLADLSYDFERLTGKGPRTPSSTSATPSRSAASSRILPRAPRPPRSVPTRANSPWCPRSRCSPCTRARTWAGRAC
jgi:PhzF family phenazine biosynthesis protein